MFEYLYLVPLLPLAAFVINGLFRTRLQKGSCRRWRWRSRPVVSPFVRSSSTFCLQPGQRVFEQVLFSWIPIGNLQLDMAFLLDPLSAVMIMVVSGVGFLIHVYSIGYMAHDPGIKAVIHYLNLFMFSMLTWSWEQPGAAFHRLGRRRVVQLSADRVWFTKKSAADAARSFFVNADGRFSDFCWALLSSSGQPDAAIYRNWPSCSGGFCRRRRAVTAATMLLFFAPPANRRRYRFISGFLMPWKALPRCRR